MNLCKFVFFLSLSLSLSLLHDRKCCRSTIWPLPGRGDASPALDTNWYHLDSVSTNSEVSVAFLNQMLFLLWSDELLVEEDVKRENVGRDVLLIYYLCA